MTTSHHQIAFELTTDEQGRKVLRAIGDVDLQTAQALRQHITRTAEPGESLVIDLRQVTFMDSPGLGTLIYCDRLQRQRGGHLVLRSPVGMVRDLFEVVHLANVLEIE